MTNPSLCRANRCLVGDGTRVPVDEAEEAEEPSSSRVSSREFIESNVGASGGSLANLDLAKDFWSSLMKCKWGHGVLSISRGASQVRRVMKCKLQSSKADQLKDHPCTSLHVTVWDYISPTMADAWRLMLGRPPFEYPLTKII